MDKAELFKIAKPILCSTWDVQSIQDNRKTQTRQLIKPRYREDECGFRVCTNKGTGERWAEKYDENEMPFDKPRYVFPKYQPGDILYVRETWKPIGVTTNYGNDGAVVYQEKYWAYRADGYGEDCRNWKPSIHMSKEAARIFLRVTRVRVERLQDINYDNGDIWAEGIPAIHDRNTEISNFVSLWDSTIKPKDMEKYGWNANPWVWVYEFELVSPDR